MLQSLRLLRDPDVLDVLEMDPEEPDLEESASTQMHLVKCVASACLSALLLPLWTYSHEIGHLLAVHLLYVDASPTIALDQLGYSGGNCTWKHEASLSPLGDSFGRAACYTLAFLAGPAVNVLTAAIGASLLKPSKVPVLLYPSAGMVHYALIDGGMLQNLPIMRRSSVPCSKTVQRRYRLHRGT